MKVEAPQFRHQANKGPTSFIDKPSKFFCILIDGAAPVSLKRPQFSETWDLDKGNVINWIKVHNKKRLRNVALSLRAEVEIS